MKRRSVFLKPDANDGLPARLRCLERAEFHQADGGEEFRLVERGFEAADGIGLADGNRHLQDLLGEPGNVRNARAAAAEKNARAQIIIQPGLFQILRDQLEDFLQPQRHDALEMLDVDGLERQAEFVGDGDGLALDFLVQQRGAVFELEFFRAAQRHFQSVSQIVGNVVAAHRQHAGMPDDAARIHDVIGRAAANVNDQRAQFLLLARQQRQRRGEAVEDDFVHLQLQPFHEPDGVLQAVGVAVDDVNVHFQARPEHADRVGHAVLAVHEKMLADGVNDVVFRGQIDRFRVLDDVLHVVLGDLAIGGDHRMHAAIVEAADVAAGHAEIDVADFHVGHLLGFDDGVAHVLLGLGRVRDLALAHAARARLAKADDIQRAVGALLAHDGADLRRADFQADDDG